MRGEAARPSARRVSYLSQILESAYLPRQEALVDVHYKDTPRLLTHKTRGAPSGPAVCGRCTQVSRSQPVEQEVSGFQRLVEDSLQKVCVLWIRDIGV